MLIGQARVEASRHEQKRAQAAERVAGGVDGKADPKDVAETYASLVTLTRRAVLMDAQVDLLEGKRRALARHRAAIADVLARLDLLASDAAAAATAETNLPPSLSPSLSRVVLSAQEDLRRQIARAMHDGPAQSLTNIVLQAQIVERLLERDPLQAKGELRLLVHDGPADPGRDQDLHLRRAADGARRPGAGAHPPAGDAGPRASCPRPGRVRVPRPGPPPVDGRRERGLPRHGRGAGRLPVAEPRADRHAPGLDRRAGGPRLRPAHARGLDGGTASRDAHRRRPRRDPAHDPGPP